MSGLVIVGAGGHGKVVADIALKSEYEKIVFLDDFSQKEECAGFPIVGGTNKIPEYSDWDFIVAIGNAASRKKIMDALSSYNIVSLIHPSAVISRRVKIGKGAMVLAGAVINSDTVIGNGCIIGTCASVDHDDVIGDYVHVAVGAHLCGTVTVGDMTWIGAGATVSNNINICGCCMIGAGAVVINNLEDRGTYIGVPAVKML